MAENMVHILGVIVSNNLWIISLNTAHYVTLLFIQLFKVSKFYIEKVLPIIVMSPLRV